LRCVENQNFGKPQLATYDSFGMVKCANQCFFEFI